MEGSFIINNKIDRSENYGIAITMKTCSFIIYFLYLIWSVPVGNAATDETIKMQLSWKHQFQFAGYYAAIEKGFYKDQGLTVELVEGGPGVICNERTLLAQVQYCNGTGSVVKQRIDGEAIVVLASIIQHSPAVLVTLKSSGLVTPKDLIGKRVEAFLAGEPIPEIKAMFQREGISLDRLISRENSLGIDALINKEVDAKYVFLTNEVYELDSLGVDYHVISPESYGIDFYGDALFTSELEVSEHPQRVKKFLAASIKGWEYAMANKAEIAQLIVQKYQTNKSYKQLVAEAEAIEKLMLHDLIPIGHINKAHWIATADTLKSMGMVKHGYSLDGFIYEQNDDAKYAGPHNFLTFLLSVTLLASLVLWVFNRKMSVEIKMRAEAQDQLSLANLSILKKAYTDELTGMGNRRSFYEQAEAEISLAKLDGSSLAALLIDIDHFKNINDQYGHSVGDEVLQKFGEVILQLVRANDVQGRIGGEEFAVLTTKTDLDGAKDLAERMRLAVEKIELISNSRIITLTISIGVTGFNAESDDIHTMLSRADKALYKAKGSGRNRVVNL